MRWIAGEKVDLIGILMKKAQSQFGTSIGQAPDMPEDIIVLVMACLFIFANCVLAWRPCGVILPIIELRRRLNDAQNLLTYAAIFLVMGVLHLWTQYN